jgi:hypothetical protein
MMIDPAVVASAKQILENQPDSGNDIDE